VKPRQRIAGTPPAYDHLSLRVLLEGRIVGTLALTRENTVAFEYADEWLVEGFSISPLSLPLEKRVFLSNYQPFEGLFGVFNDSLPDGWGRLLVDRMLLRQGIQPAAIDPLVRLAIVGGSGMGALAYEPEIDWEHSLSTVDLDVLAQECERILNADSSESLDDLFMLGGSSGEAQPKILIEYEGKTWLVKFFTAFERTSAGLMEYEYSLAARDCGITMPKTRLFPSVRGPGYFGVRRFDRLNRPDGTVRRVHMTSVSALLETSYRIPNLDYQTLARLTLRLTQSFGELERLYRLACFNVLAHNRDDHSRNFSFIYDESAMTWRLSPAYDLTYSPGMRGEHATTLNGKGRDITTDKLREFGVQIGLSKSLCRSITAKIREKTHPLQKWQP
jgi:serine/threonine-protein kinase HipA